MQRRWLVIGGGIALGVLAWHLPGTAPRSAAARSPADRQPVRIAASLAEPGVAPPPGPTAPRDVQRVLHEGSLRGTTVDGGVTVGFAGHIHPDLALRRLFDYYLSTLGEVDLESVGQLLRADLRQRPLDGGQQAEVMQLFARYVAYQQARTALASLGGEDLAARLTQDRALRRRMLGDALAQAFYPTAEADDAWLLRALAQADEPAQVQTATVATSIQAQTDQMEAAGLPPAARHAQRAAMWGEPAARRLDALDRERARRQQRLDAFATLAAGVQGDASLDPARRQQAVQRLLDRYFDGPERLQAQAMWQAGLLSAAH